MEGLYVGGQYQVFWVVIFVCFSLCFLSFFFFFFFFLRLEHTASHNRMSWKTCAIMNRAWYTDRTRVVWITSFSPGPTMFFLGCKTTSAAVIATWILCDSIIWSRKMTDSRATIATAWIPDHTK